MSISPELEQNSLKVVMRLFVPLLSFSSPYSIQCLKKEDSIPTGHFTPKPLSQKTARICSRSPLHLLDQEKLERFGYWLLPVDKETP